MNPQPSNVLFVEYKKIPLYTTGVHAQRLQYIWSKCGSFVHPGYIRWPISKKTGQSHAVSNTDPDTWAVKELRLPLNFDTLRFVMQ